MNALSMDLNALSIFVPERCITFGAWQEKQKESTFLNRNLSGVPALH